MGTKTAVYPGRMAPMSVWCRVLLKAVVVVVASTAIDCRREVARCSQYDRAEAAFNAIASGHLDPDFMHPDFEAVLESLEAVPSDCPRKSRAESLASALRDGRAKRQAHPREVAKAAKTAKAEASRRAVVQAEQELRSRAMEGWTLCRTIRVSDGTETGKLCYPRSVGSALHVCNSLLTVRGGKTTHICDCTTDSRRVADDCRGP